MPCYSPLSAFSVNPIYKDGTVGKREIVWSENAINPNHIAKKIEIPCGQCIGCRLAYSREWANRCMLEAKEHKNNWFLTVTYRDEHLPLTPIVNTETGELTHISTLRPKDIQKFIKDLRRYYEHHYNHKGIRFYLCGEYGSLTERAHYHILIYNLPIYDLKLHKKMRTGPLYNSETLEKIWKKGFIGICEMTWETCAYTARYMMKKHKGERAKEYYENKGIEPEFCRMSRRPGIGKKYFDLNKEEIYKNDEIWLTGGNGKAKKIKPPKYYDKLYDIENHDEMEQIKAEREYKLYENEKTKMTKTTLSKEEQRNIEKRAKEETLKVLIRPFE